jgi:hypothetical protein
MTRSVSVVDFEERQFETVPVQPSHYCWRHKRPFRNNPTEVDLRGFPRCKKVLRY